MDPADLTRRLDLQPHPEGGAYREIHRCQEAVSASDGRQRAAGTLIHFLLAAGEVSRWHRVASDEAWIHLDGDELELCDAGSEAAGLTCHRLGRPRAGALAEAVIPAGHWQAARSTGAWSLVCCAVFPGFDFADFELVAPGPIADRLAALPGGAAFC